MKILFLIVPQCILITCFYTIFNVENVFVNMLAALLIAVSLITNVYCIGKFVNKG